LSTPRRTGKRIRTELPSWCRNSSGNVRTGMGRLRRRFRIIRKRPFSWLGILPSRPRRRLRRKGGSGRICMMRYCPMWRRLVTSLVNSVEGGYLAA